MDTQNKYTQAEILDLLQQYNSTPRQTIKQNLKLVKIKYNIKNPDIIDKMECKYQKVTSWFNSGNPVIPTFEDSLRLAETFGFSITELM